MWCSLRAKWSSPSLEIQKWLAPPLSRWLFGANRWLWNINIWWGYARNCKDVCHMSPINRVSMCINQMAWFHHVSSLCHYAACSLRMIDVYIVSVWIKDLSGPTGKHLTFLTLGLNSMFCQEPNFPCKSEGNPSKLDLIGGWNHDEHLGPMIFFWLDLILT